MKNIQILPTDKPSKLWFDNAANQFIYGINSVDGIYNCKNQNIYILNSEEIKEGDYGLGTNNSIYKFDKTTTLHCVKMFECKKIILTTDQNLIKDGVQSIPDDFLQWFVKNPNCEEVEVNQEFNPKDMIYGINTNPYKIVIPKEELERGITITHVGKQETLEEAGIIAANICQHLDAKEQAFFIAGFQECIKWQQKIRA